MNAFRLFVAVMLTVVVAAECWSQGPAEAGSSFPPRRPPAPATQWELREKLEAPMSAEFVETPLKDVVAYSADFLDLQIVLDHRSLEEAAIGVDTPVTINLKNVKASTALKTILGQFGEGAAALEFVRRDGFLEIATRAKLDKEMEPRVYVAGDLPGVTPDSPDVDEAINLIQTAIEPTSWQTRGGEGTITHLGPILVIRQSPRVHDQIGDLLHEAREAIAQVTKAKQ